MRVIYHPDAEAELREAALFYDQQVRAWVVRFFALLNQRSRKLKVNPSGGRLSRAIYGRGLCGVFHMQFITESSAMSCGSSWSSTTNAIPTIGDIGFVT